MTRDDWIGWIQIFLEERVRDAPDESCKTFARQLWDMTAESDLLDEDDQLTPTELRAAIKDALADFYTPDEAETWLTSRHPLLNWKTAEEMIVTGEGECVLLLIRRLDEGVYL